MKKIVRIIGGAVLMVLAFFSSFGVGSITFESLILGIVGILLLFGPMLWRAHIFIKKNTDLMESCCECSRPGGALCSHKARYIVSFVAMDGSALYDTRSKVSLKSEYYACENHHPHIGKDTWWIQNAEAHGFKVHLIQKIS